MEEEQQELVCTECFCTTDKGYHYPLAFHNLRRPVNLWFCDQCYENTIRKETRMIGVSQPINMLTASK